MDELLVRSLTYIEYWVYKTDVLPRRRMVSGTESVIGQSDSFTTEKDMGILEKSETRELGLILPIPRRAGYSRNLCQSAICRRGELHTSFQ